MFLNDVNKKEEIRNLAVQDLKNLGVKYRPKKPRQLQNTKSRRVFKTPLQSLPMQVVTLDSGQQLVVPKLVHELCSYIVTKIDTEGLFRKGGSKSRQNEIRLSLDAGCSLGDDHHEIDVASVLKTFFRELPEPLFPYSYHELFLHCMILPGKNLDAVLLACLLLPCEHLNTLAYFMQFLNRITQYSLLNKMDAYNLAVIIGPTLFPVEEKVATHTAYRLTRTCELFKLLVENAPSIGVLPESIIERIALSSSSTSLTDEDNAVAKKKKKRRSGSLTRMFNGLRKIVGSKIGDEISGATAITPDLLRTPCMTQSSKKRKIENGGFSAKKKREILNKLPHHSALNTPYTPVSGSPNPKKSTPPDTCKKSHTTKTNGMKSKKSQWSLKSKTKNSESSTSGVSNGAKRMLERRWSQVSQVANFRKSKKRNSCSASVMHTNAQSQKTDCDLKKSTNAEPEYVRISKLEYEEIKCRVSAIERRLSIELESEELQKLNNLQNVQCAYEQTLVQTEPLSPTTDHLARRLSRDLKIRRSTEQKIIRSPSARKIGSLRRRSRELEKQTMKLNRTQSWHVPKSDNAPQVNLQTDLAQPSSETNGLKECRNSNNFIANSFKNSSISRASFHSDTLSSSSTHNSKGSSKWLSADGFFSNQTPRVAANKESSRASLARLRSQNAGMVLAKAKLFDALTDSDNSQTKTAPSTPNNIVLPRVRPNKIGGVLRNSERQSYRVKALKAADDKRSGKSPRKRMCKSPNSMRHQRLNIIKASNLTNILHETKYINKENNINEANLLSSLGKASPLKDCNYEVASPNFTTPKNCPHIKKTFNVKSPKRLNRTPVGAERKATPLKVIASSRQNY